MGNELGKILVQNGLVFALREIIEIISKTSLFKGYHNSVYDLEHLVLNRACQYIESINNFNTVVSISFLKAATVMTVILFKKS